MDTGLLVDLVTGAVGAQPRDSALHLQQFELGLVQFLLEPRELTLGDSQLPVALLVGGVAAAEQFQLLLLVLRAGVGLRRDLAQLHFQLIDAATGGGKPVLKAGPFDLGEVGAVLRGLALRTHVEDGLLRVLHPLPQPPAERAALGASAPRLPFPFFYRTREKNHSASAPIPMFGNHAATAGSTTCFVASDAAMFAIT